MLQDFVHESSQMLIPLFPSDLMTSMLISSLAVQVLLKKRKEKKILFV